MSRHVLHFADVSLDIAARELRRGGERVVLPPTVFDCIAYLVEHRDRAVGRDELVAAVWGKTAVSDTMLGKAILAARRAVGDTAEAQALLRTVPRFGYHWIGAIRDEEAAAVEAPADKVDDVPVATRLPAPRRRATMPLVFALALLALIGLAAIFVSLHTARETAADIGATAAATANPAIAVLPVEVLGDTGDGWLRLGLMDLLANRLRDAGMTVVPSDNVVRVVSAGMSAQQSQAAVRAAMDTRALILPAARKSGDRWIVRAESIDASGNRRVAEAQAANPVAAADALANRLLEQFGRPAARAIGTHADMSLTELLQRTDAARLAENLDLARAVIAQAPAALQALPEVRERGVRIDLRAGQFDKARSEIEALLAEVPSETEPVMHARLLENLCSAMLRLARLADATAACDRAVALLEPRNEPLALGRTYNDRGIIHMRLGEYDEALADFSRSRIALTLAGDPLLLAQLDGNESIVQKIRGRPAEALLSFERSGRTFQRFGMINEFVISLVNEIDANLLLLRPLEALQASDAGWAERNRITDPQVRQAFDNMRADALAANGRLDEARGMLDGLIHATDPPPDKTRLALARKSEATIDLDVGDATAALLLARQALPDLSVTEDEPEHARAWLLIVRALHTLGRVDEAAQEVTAFATWAATRHAAPIAMDAALAQAEHLAFGDSSDATIAAYEQAMQHATDCGVPRALREAAVSYADYLLAKGRPAPAAAVIGKIAGFTDRDFPSALVEARLYQALGQRDAWDKALIRATRLAGQRRIPDRLRTFAAEPPLAQAD